VSSPRAPLIEIEGLLGGSNPQTGYFMASPSHAMIAFVEELLHAGAYS
jgi:hypothetical protein